MGGLLRKAVPKSRILPAYQEEQFLGAVLHFDFNLEAGTTNWHCQKGGRGGYQASQAMLSPPWGMLASQQPIHVWEIIAAGAW